MTMPLSERQWQTLALKVAAAAVARGYRPGSDASDVHIYGPSIASVVRGLVKPQPPGRGKP